MHYQNQYVVITGPIGIGKSELARVYAKNYQIQKNANIIWVDCQNTSSTIKQFYNLAKKLELFDIYNDLSKISSVIFYVLRSFESENTLFVFDGAEPQNTIIRDISYFFINNKLINVIITSRESIDWEDTYFILSLKKLTAQQSLTYMENCFKHSSHYDRNQFEKLIVALRYIPKALNVSCEYFHEERLKSSFKMDSFIKEVTVFQKIVKIKEHLHGIAEEDLGKFSRLFENALVQCIFDRILRPFDVSWIEVSKDYVNLLKMVQSKRKKSIENSVINWESIYKY